VEETNMRMMIGNTEFFVSSERVFKKNWMAESKIEWGSYVDGYRIDENARCSLSPLHWLMVEAVLNSDCTFDLSQHPELL
jgi:hypothetical protein